MSYNIIIFIVFPLLSAPILAETENQLTEGYGSVVHATMVCRHGDRTPVDIYPKYNMMQKWKEGAGQLTDLGKQESYNLGEYFRNCYGHLLGDQYNESFVRFSSSDYNRTIESATKITAAIYSRDSAQKIPINIFSKSEDNVLSYEKQCDRIEFEKKKLDNIPEEIQFYYKNKEIIDYISSHTGFEFTVHNLYETVFHLQVVHDVLHIEEIHNYTLPEWACHVYPLPLEIYAIKSLNYFSYSPEMLRLRTSVFFQMLGDEMRKFIGLKSQLKFSLFSAHDITVSTLLLALGADLNFVVSYSSCIIFELRKKANLYFITVAFKNSTTLSLLKLHDCKNIGCKFSEFEKAIDRYCVTDWQKECEIPSNTNASHDEPFYNKVFQFFSKCYKKMQDYCSTLGQKFRQLVSSKW